MKEPLDIKAIKKEKLQDWLAKLQDFQIYAPVRREKYTEFALIEDFSDLDLGIRNTILSPKDKFLSQTKTMFKFDLGKSKDQPKLESTDFSKTPKQLILGIRSCDSHAISSLDYTFDSDSKDPYYVNKRKNTVLVGLACNEPDINCFCKSMGGGPFDGSNMDILMVELEDSYLFNIYSDSGTKLTELSPELFDTPTKEQNNESEQLWAAALTKFIRTIDTSNKPDKLGKTFESDYWEQVSKKCLACGICTFLCPTCYCFDITDENRGTEGERVRTWDSCMYPEYTVHASGYNPRPARMNRLRNRVYHKFKYYPDLYNVFGCTGCGRCIRHCPVNIDIIDIVNGINDLDEGGN